MDLKLTATAVKDWFQYRCERKIVYQTMKSESRRSVPITEATLSSAWAEFGNDFENDLVKCLTELNPGSVLTPNPGKRNLSERQTRRFLLGKTPESYACQAVLSGSDEIHKSLSLPEGVSISKTKPDIIKRTKLEDGSFIFHIIDIKATQQSAMFHKTQVAFYAVLLKAIFEQMGLSNTHSVDIQGAIWRLPDTGSCAAWTEDSFVLKPYAELVVDFMRRELSDIAQKEVSSNKDTTFFHVYFKCEQCKYLPHCLSSLPPEQSPKEADLSSIAGMSHQAKKSLHTLRIQTVGELLSKQHQVHEHATSWALRARGSTLIARANALINGEVSRIPERFSWQMPPRTNVGIYLLTDYDPIHGRLFSLACSISRPGSELEHTIKLAKEPSEELQCIKDVLGVVTKELLRIDAENQAEGQTVVHIFVYEPSEAQDLSEALGRHLGDEGVSRGLLDLIRMFPPEDIQPEPNYKGIHHLPACSLRSIVQSLYTLPAVVSLDLRSVTQAIANFDDSIEPYQPHAQEFTRPFSSRLSLSLIQQVRRDPNGQRELLEEIEHDITNRLEAMHRLRVWIEDDNAASSSNGFLRLQKGPFRFQSSFNPLDTSQLDILLAQELLQNRVGQMAALVEISRPVAERISRFACYANLTYARGPWKYKNYGKKAGIRFDIPHENLGVELGNDTLGLILTDNNPDVLLNPQAWTHYKIDLVTNSEYEKPDQLKVEMKLEDFENSPFSDLWARNKGGYWFIDKTFVDFNTERIEAFLRFLDAGDKE